MKRILVPVGCRSDEGLSAPVIRRLRAADWCKVITLHLNPQDFLGTYQLVDACLRADPPDLIVITGDRVEMCAAAAAAFHNKIKIAHLYAGIVNDPVTTFDDVDRHCITLWSDIQLCENEEAKQNVVGDDPFVPGGVLWSIKEPNCHVVGITHLDDLVIDESKVPYVMENGAPGVIMDYDLVLVNGEPLSNAGFIWDKERMEIQISANPDLPIGKIVGTDIIYSNLPRPQFLGLLKNCQRFITNSSAAIYEAPHFLKPEQIVMVGDRNKNRPRGPFKTGASDRVVEVLRQYANRS